MREIKFRAKERNINEWIYGYYSFEDEIFDGAVCTTYRIMPETLGQFTGLLDKNGKEVYECDMLKTINDSIGVAIWFKTGWRIAFYSLGYNGIKSYTAVESFYTDEIREWEVIGNIYDNPELLNQ